MSDSEPIETENIYYYSYEKNGCEHKFMSPHDKNELIDKWKVIMLNNKSKKLKNRHYDLKCRIDTMKIIKTVPIKDFKLDCNELHRINYY